MIKQLVRKAGFTLERVSDDENVYDSDGLRSVHNHDFLTDPRFTKAYARGVQAAEDYGWQWRVHIGLWAAECAAKLDGDFVECGVNRGFLSSAIMQYLDWDATGKTFYLLDTFAGLDERHIDESDSASSAAERNRMHLDDGFYVSGVESVKANFSQWQNVRIVEGPVPDTLDAVHTRRIAYLHLDMNCAPPEVAAFNHLWDSLVPGAFVLLDDYAYKSYESQKHAMDAAALVKQHKIASLPTGQGLLIKSAA